MTEPGIYYPDTLSALQLDSFLANGWYRMGQGIFTTNYITQNGSFYRVYWLRYLVNRLKEGKTTRQILAINQRFSTSIQPLKITPETENLFSLYKTGIDFETAESVIGWLYDDSPANVYDSWMVEVRDEGLLIAVGIFDKGHQSIAGILNFYHPAYKKYSPGKLLMLLKIKYAVEQQMLWYYPGYIVHGYPKFDYKLFAGKSAAELYDPAICQWLPYTEGLADEMAKQGPFI
jgi:leucyl-tRNA---protein transferase